VSLQCDQNLLFVIDREEFDVLLIWLTGLLLL